MPRCPCSSGVSQSLCWLREDTHTHTKSSSVLAYSSLIDVNLDADGFTGRGSAYIFGCITSTSEKFVPRSQNLARQVAASRVCAAQLGLIYTADKAVSLPSTARRRGTRGEAALQFIFDRPSPRRYTSGFLKQSRAYRSTPAVGSRPRVARLKRMRRPRLFPNTHSSLPPPSPSRRRWGRWRFCLIQLWLETSPGGRLMVVNAGREIATKTHLDFIGGHNIKHGSLLCCFFVVVVFLNIFSPFSPLLCRKRVAADFRRRVEHQAVCPLRR